MPEPEKLNELGWTKRMWRFLQLQYPDDGLRIGRERQLWDRSRVDILTDRLAIEVDWAYKWAEAIGQSAWYSFNFRRQQGICLLSGDLKDDARHIYRAQVICALKEIEFWLVDTSKNVILIDNDPYDLPTED